MKDCLFSINKQLVKRITRRGWMWILILWVSAIGFYLEFFDWYLSLGLALYITVVIVAMLLVGYLRLGSKFKFPVWEFLAFTLLFSGIRFVYIYFFLSKHLPEYTLFHYPGRALPATIFASSSLLFLGYSYAIYEWGLAARQRYSERSKKLKENFDQPILLRCSSKTVYLLPQDILYVKANGEYVDYNTSTKKYTCFKRLKEVQLELATFGFLRTHRSYIVNPSFVESINTTEICLTEGTLIPVGKTYKESIKSIID